MTRDPADLAVEARWALVDPLRVGLADPLDARGGSEAATRAESNRRRDVIDAYVLERLDAIAGDREPPRAVVRHAHDCDCSPSRGHVDPACELEGRSS